MKSQSAKRKHDGITVDGIYFEQYTPATDSFTSPGLGVELEYAHIQLSQDANVTFVNYAGQLVTAFPLSKGRHYFLVKEVRVVSAGVVAIIHDGIQKTTEQEMNTPIYP